MIFRIGYLRLADGEQVVIGDPCYVKDSRDAMYTLKLDWLAGDYPVCVDVVTERGVPRVAALLVGYDDGRSVVRFWGRAEHAAELGVDSGQMSVIAAGALADWTDENSFADFVPDTNDDYIACCWATTRTQLNAAASPKRIVKPGDYAAATIATVFAASSGYGDGVYDLTVFRDGNGNVTGFGVTFFDEADDGVADGDEYDYEYDEE